MPAEVDELAARAIDRMKELGGEAAERIGRIESGGGRRIQGEGAGSLACPGCGGVDGRARPARDLACHRPGACITVPQTEQVRWAALEKKREKISGSWVSMLLTATRSR